MWASAPVGIKQRGGGCLYHGEQHVGHCVACVEVSLGEVQLLEQEVMLLEEGNLGGGVPSLATDAEVSLDHVGDGLERKRQGGVGVSCGRHGHHAAGWLLQWAAAWIGVWIDARTGSDVMAIGRLCLRSGANHWNGGW